MNLKMEDDDIEIFNKRLKELNDSLDIIKKYGFDEDILISHLMVKLKVAKKQAIQIIESYNDFYEKTIKKMVIKSLK